MQNINSLYGNPSQSNGSGARPFSLQPTPNQQLRGRFADPAGGPSSEFVKGNQVSTGGVYPGGYGPAGGAMYSRTAGKIGFGAERASSAYPHAQSAGHRVTEVGHERDYNENQQFRRDEQREQTVQPTEGADFKNQSPADFLQEDNQKKLVTPRPETDSHKDENNRGAGFDLAALINQRREQKLVDKSRTVQNNHTMTPKKLKYFGSFVSNESSTVGAGQQQQLRPNGSIPPARYLQNNLDTNYVHRGREQENMPGTNSYDETAKKVTVPSENMMHLNSTPHGTPRRTTGANAKGMYPQQQYHTDPQQQKLVHPEQSLVTYHPQQQQPPYVQQHGQFHDDQAMHRQQTSGYEVQPMQHAQPEQQRPQYHPNDISRGHAIPAAPHRLSPQRPVSPQQIQVQQHHDSALQIIRDYKALIQGERQYFDILYTESDRRRHIETEFFVRFQNDIVINYFLKHIARGHHESSREAIAQAANRERRRQEHEEMIQRELRAQQQISELQEKGTKYEATIEKLHGQLLQSQHDTMVINDKFEQVCHILNQKMLVNSQSPNAKSGHGSHQTSFNDVQDDGPNTSHPQHPYLVGAQHSYLGSANFSGRVSKGRSRSNSVSQNKTSNVLEAELLRVQQKRDTANEELRKLDNGVGSSRNKFVTKAQERIHRHKLEREVEECTDTIKTLSAKIGESSRHQRSDSVSPTRNANQQQWQPTESVDTSSAPRLYKTRAEQDALLAGKVGAAPPNARKTTVLPHVEVHNHSSIESEEMGQGTIDAFPAAVAYVSQSVELSKGKQHEAKRSTKASLEADLTRACREKDLAERELQRVESGAGHKLSKAKERLFKMNLERDIKKHEQEISELRAQIKELR